MILRIKYEFFPRIVRKKRTIRGFFIVSARLIFFSAYKKIERHIVQFRQRDKYGQRR